MAFEDQQTILARRVRNRISDVFDIEVSILSFLSDVVVEDGTIAPELRLEYADSVQPEVFDCFENVLVEETKRYELCQRIIERFNHKFPTHGSLLRAMVDEVVDEGQIKVVVQKIFGIERQKEALEYLKRIAKEELTKDLGKSI